jgi:hypothetical protein
MTTQQQLPPSYQQAGPPMPPPYGPAFPAPYPSAAPGTVDVRTLWGAASCVAIAIGSFGAWVTAGPFSISGTADTAGDGWVTLVCAVLALVLVLAPFSASVVTGLLALVVLAVAVYDLSRLGSLNDSESIISVNPGWGLLLVLAGSVSLLVYCVLCRRSSSTPAAQAWHPAPPSLVPPAHPPGAFAAPAAVAPARHAGVTTNAPAAAPLPSQVPAAPVAATAPPVAEQRLEAPVTAPQPTQLGPYGRPLRPS